ncbi:uncharacterized protein LOC111088164 [Limulus polyphemus]|uniref:Uncharacterized protein LOC111088164 n=1 Tax=Limulus polyphemus TaxID=6850 RepID=A0ABM1TB01_LIMPO|nr:uncharacterized protein LOC111088164 [Limulus polyphemus]XP_022253055.1 uncharacterized protein LOC111088164 [Limulus polyphemus]XP_022253057.1 uncharacterized protein LOC111088164 [Limulus polyphemus]XP_022253058.1 uncharacterized protein LOC111088164 [Limulus polyphemus]
MAEEKRGFVKSFLDMCFNGISFGWLSTEEARQRNEQNRPAVVVDGMQYILNTKREIERQNVEKEKGVEKLGKSMKDYVHQLFDEKNASTVVLVFDNYGERKGVPKMKHHSTKEKYSMRQFIGEICEVLIDDLQNELDSEQTFTCVGHFDKEGIGTVTQVSSGGVRNLENVRHDEADTIMWNVAAKLPEQHVILQSPDSDMVMIGLGLMEYFSNKIISMELENSNINVIDGKTLVKFTKELPVLQSFTDDERIEFIQIMYVITGCDYIQYYFDMDKKFFLEWLKCIPKNLYCDNLMTFTYNLIVTAIVSRQVGKENVLNVLKNKQEVLNLNIPLDTEVLFSELKNNVKMKRFLEKIDGMKSNDDFLYENFESRWRLTEKTLKMWNNSLSNELPETFDICINNLNTERTH